MKMSANSRQLSGLALALLFCINVFMQIPNIITRAGLGLLAPIVAAGALTGCKDSSSTTTAAPTGISKVGHVIVIYMENHSFDNLYGEFPGANGLTAPLATHTQTDSNGKTYKYLPQPINTGASPPAPDPRFPWNLKNGPFCIDDYVTPDQEIPDLVHRFYQEQIGRA